jgi:hypothetical protein
MSQALKTISTTKTRPDNLTEATTNISYNQSRLVQVDIDYFQWLQAISGHWRSHGSTPEHVNSRRKHSELRDQMANIARSQHCRRWSWVHDHSYKSIARNHQLKHLQWKEWSYL